MRRESTGAIRLRADRARAGRVGHAGAMRLTDDLKDLASVRPFRTLLAVRLVSQTGDGLVQAGLASLFFFAPQNLTSVTGVATALVVMLAPFCVVGPFTGPFIDRWRRRQTLRNGNLGRSAVVGATAVVLGAVGTHWSIYLLALVALGINRFLLAVMGSGLPQIVDRQRLLVANSVVPVLSGGATAGGALIGFGLRLALPPGGAQDTASLASAAVLYLLAAGVVTRLGPDQLGPSRSSHAGERGLASAVVATAGDLADAVRYLVRRGTPGLALSAMAMGRFVYGMELITIILTSRNLLASPADADLGLALFGSLMAAMIAGHGVSVVLTPLARTWVEPQGWVVVCLVGGTVGQAVVAASHAYPAMLVGIFIFGIGVQGAKIAVDTIVQRDTADVFRGRAFSLYDVLFNSAECVAAGVGILVLPDVGWSRPVQVGLIVFVWLVAAGFCALMRALGGRPRPTPWDGTGGGDRARGRSRASGSTGPLVG